MGHPDAGAAGRLLNIVDSSLRVIVSPNANIDIYCCSMATSSRVRKTKTVPPRTRNRHPTTAQLRAFQAWLECKREDPSAHPSVAAVSARLELGPTGARPLLEACEKKGLLQRKPITTLGPYELGDEGRRWLPKLGALLKAADDE